MKVLLTGSFEYSEKQIEQIKLLGYEIIFCQYENNIGKDANDVDVIIGNQIFLFNDYKKFTNLKFFQATSAGLDRIPKEVLNNNQVIISNAKGVYSIPIAEFVIARILEIYKKTNDIFQNQKNHNWERNIEIKELYGKTALIIGAGSIGSEIAKRLNAFEVKTIGIHLSKTDKGVFNEIDNIENIDKYISVSDFVILTVPYTNDNKNMINKNNLMLLKKDTVLINVSRGELIEENDLQDCLKNDEIKVISDVFKKEPLDENSPLWDCENMYLSPHISFRSENIKFRMYDLIYYNLQSFINNGIIRNNIKERT